MDTPPSRTPAPPLEEDVDSDVGDLYEPGDYGPEIQVRIKFPPEKFEAKWAIFREATIQDLLDRISGKFPDYDWTLSKAIVEKRVPGVKSLLKATEDGQQDLNPLNGNSIRLMAPKHETQKSLQDARAAALAHTAARKRAAGKSPRAARTQVDQYTQYTFYLVHPLEHLPNPERSLRLLERLKADPGIRAAMRKHQLKVQLLTEMDPSQYTQADHEGTTRILGLNRNRGETIELRLRTDAYDGYRDYKTIRKTLCHELAHNVHSEHNRHFWDLCHQIEREVHDADYLSSGRTVGNEEYRPVEDESDEDSGGWVGGEFRLGGQRPAEGVSRREILAHAVEARLKVLAGEQPPQWAPGRERQQSGSGSRPGADADAHPYPDSDGDAGGGAGNTS